MDQELLAIDIDVVAAGLKVADDEVLKITKMIGSRKVAISDISDEEMDSIAPLLTLSITRRSELRGDEVILEIGRETLSRTRCEEA